MAQKNLSNKKYIIPLSKLPYPNADGTHRIRFRITTQDRNEISEWSPIFIVDSPAQRPSASATYVTQQSGTVITASWEPNNNYKEYDVLVSYDSQDLIFYSRVSNPNANIKVDAASTIRIVVQLPTYPFPPSYAEDFVLLDTGTLSL